MCDGLQRPQRAGWRGCWVLWGCSIWNSIVCDKRFETYFAKWWSMTMRSVRQAADEKQFRWRSYSLHWRKVSYSLDKWFERDLAYRNERVLGSLWYWFSVTNWCFRRGMIFNVARRCSAMAMMPISEISIGKWPIRSWDASNLRRRLTASCLWVLCTLSQGEKWIRLRKAASQR